VADANAETDPRVWAYEHVQISWTNSGKHAATYIAQIKADGLVFEGRAFGLVVKSRIAKARATDEAVRNYLEFLGRVGT
jgi:hypothetical protein